MSNNATSVLPKERRIINGNDLKKAMRRYKYVCIEAKYDLYTRAILPVDKRHFIEAIEQQPDKFDFMYEIDDNYTHTLYIERVIKTPKQPAGGTVDAPGPSLVP